MGDHRKDPLAVGRLEAALFFPWVVFLGLLAGAAWLLLPTGKTTRLGGDLFVEERPRGVRFPMHGRTGQG